MKIKTLKSKALSMCLVVAIVATYSMVALAGDKLVGEILVSGKNVNGQAPVVTVNGEAVKSGRTIFTSSTISTPKDTTATVNVAKIGKVKIAPNSTLSVSFDEKGITGNLSSGKLTVLNSSNNVAITTPNGEVAQLQSGDAVTTKQDDDDDDDDNGKAIAIWAIVFGGAAAAILYAATRDSGPDIGGGTTVVSPNV